MFDISRRQFILKQSSGRTLNILHKEAAGICLSTLNKKGVWNTPIIIAKNAVPEFCAYMDGNDGVHILHQDKNGSITYSYYDNTTWKSIPLTAGRNAVQSLRQLWIGGFGKNIFMFYTIEYPGSIFLYCQEGNIHGELMEPHVLDTLENTSSIYRPAIDISGNVCVFYRQKCPTSKILGYRVNNIPTGIWSDFILYKEETGSDNPGIVSICFDADNNLHILWSSASNTNHTLYHSVKNLKEAHWHKEISIAASDRPFVNSALITPNKLLAAYWVNENNIYYRTSTDNGRTWNHEALYTKLKGRYLYCMSYSNNVRDEDPQASSLCLPGSYVDGYKLAFINDLHVSETDPGYLQLITEIEKLNIRLSLMEAGIEKLKSDYDKIGLQAAATGEAVKTKPAESVPVIETSADPLQENVSLMPGAGFSFVTPEYLKNLKK